MNSPEAMARFTDEVRVQKPAYITAAVDAFTHLMSSEYQRLRAAQIESGASTITLNLCANFNFTAGAVEVVTVPLPVVPRARRKTIAVKTT